MRIRLRMLWHFIMLHLSEQERLQADKVWWDSFDAVVDGFTRDDPVAYLRDYQRAFVRAVERSTFGR